LSPRARRHLAVAVTRQAIDIRKAKTGKPFPEALANLAFASRPRTGYTRRNSFGRSPWRRKTCRHERAKLLSNLSTCHINEGRPQQAIEYLNQALALRPDLVGAQFNRGLANLEARQLETGLAGLRDAGSRAASADRTYRDIPEWDGTPDQTVIVWGEQGIGDEILFASCLPDMVKHSKKVILDCHPRLVATFKRSFPTVDVHGTRKIQGELEWLDDVEADGSICISSLPKFFRNCDQDFPGRPFLKRGPHAPLEGRRPKVGLAWAGGTKKTRNDLRSIPLEQWVPILRAVDADFYSLQYTQTAAREVCEMEEATGFRIRHYPSWVECRDYDKTISFVASLDLTITVCTAVHHASNAVGTPTWTLVPSKPAWRYGEKGHLWYHCTNTFYRQRQEEEGWTETIERVAADLREAF
jgi:hypothetical protein